MTGGSALTRELAKQHRKPWIHLDLKMTAYPEAARMIREWIERNGVRVMNVAGPRASKDLLIYQTTMDVLDAVIGFENENREGK